MQSDMIHAHSNPALEQWASVQEYIEARCARKGDEHTHTSIAGPAMAFYVPGEELGTFYTLYTQALERGQPLHVTEKTRHVGPAVVDFDFRYPIAEGLRRRHTPEDARELARLYLQACGEHVVLPYPCRVYVMERSGPYQHKDTTIKDGIHIVLPDIVTRNVVKHLVRERFIDLATPIIQSIGSTNTVEDVVDSAVIDKNNWMMYGSRKPNTAPYQITQLLVLEGEGEELRDASELVSQPTSQLVRLLSIRNKYTELQLHPKNRWRVEEAEQREEAENRAKMAREEERKQARLNQQASGLASDAELDLARQLVRLLRPQRADGYQDWMRVGWCLHNIDHRLLDAWVEFSKQSRKYQRGECERKWDGMEDRNDGLTIGSLHMWAKEDNLREYNALITNTRQQHTTANMRTQPSTSRASQLATQRSNSVGSQLQLATQPHTNTHTNNNDVDTLMRMLSVDRACNHTPWLDVGRCLRQIDANTLLPAWVAFSQLNTNYVEGECERLWPTLDSIGLDINALHTWAERDNPSEYMRFVNRSLHPDIKFCNGSHHSIAKIAHKLLSHKFVYAASVDDGWYVNDGVLWRHDAKQLSLRNALTNVVRGHFQLVLTQVRSAEVDDMRMDAMSSTSTTQQANPIVERLNRICAKLEDFNFKSCVVKEAQELFKDDQFLDKLDDNRNLIAFKNGVWELDSARFRAARPTDYLSLSTGYDYKEVSDPQLANQVVQYWKTLHPDDAQRDYLQRTFARQLYGDSGKQLFHIHAGFEGSASNGKSVFFEVLEKCLGQYVKKFKVALLTTKQRAEANKPAPEYEDWKGKRFLYCSEPNEDEILHSGILKEATGGEPILYRSLYANQSREFRLQAKLHIMCNNTPEVDGADAGVKRRIRKVPYCSTFVDDEEVNPALHKYKCDPGLIDAFKNNDALKMEFVRLLFHKYDHSYQFVPPDVIKKSSAAYLEENNPMQLFIKSCISKSDGAYFTASDAFSWFKQHFPAAKVKENKLRAELMKAFDSHFHAQKRIGTSNVRSVFMDLLLVEPADSTAADADAIDG